MASCKEKQLTPCSGRMTAGMCNKHYLQVSRHGAVVISRRDRRAAIVEGDSVKIPLGINAKSGYAAVDKEFAYLANDNWGLTHYGYAKRSRDKALLHRVIADAKAGQVIDHIDGNKLNNRADNLRLCTQAENARNQRIRCNNTSGYKGVSALGSKYTAQVRFNYIKKHIGVFDTALEAARAYNGAALDLHGEFARLNNV